MCGWHLKCDTIKAELKTSSSPVVKPVAKYNIKNVFVFFPLHLLRCLLLPSQFSCHALGHGHGHFTALIPLLFTLPAPKITVFETLNGDAGLLCWCIHCFQRLCGLPRLRSSLLAWVSLLHSWHVFFFFFYEQAQRRRMPSLSSDVSLCRKQLVILFHLHCTP